MKVYVQSGDLNAIVQRNGYPITTADVINTIKEAIDKHPHTKLGFLMLISRSPNRFFNKDDYWISTEWALEKAGIKIQKKKVKL